MPNPPESPIVELWLLRLYVAGDTLAGFHAQRHVHAVCEEHLGGRYQLDVFDVMQFPEQARQDNVTAVPVLIRKFPLPTRMLATDFTNQAHILNGLGIPTTA